MGDEGRGSLEWLTLTGPHAALAVGTDTARRYVTGFPPMAGFAPSIQHDLAALAPFCEPGEHLYCRRWDGPAPAGWQVHAELHLRLLTWHGPAPKQPGGVTQLTPEDLPQMLDLIAITRPGPFGPRNLELGAHFGIFIDGRLVAMAGQRFHAASWREITCVCTHPDHAGRGLGRRVVERVVNQQLQSGQMPCLYVDNDNTWARRLYSRLGFLPHAEVGVRIVSRVAGHSPVE